jgi:hypothetical protein
MTDGEYARKLAELDRLLNDPDVRLDADRIWTLLAEISAACLGQAAVAAGSSLAVPGFAGSPAAQG